MDKQLSIKEAFEAIQEFLDGLYQRTKSDDMGSLLGDLQLLSDGKPADPAARQDWLSVTELVISKRGGNANKTD